MLGTLEGEREGDRDNTKSIVLGSLEGDRELVKQAQAITIT